MHSLNWICTGHFSFQKDFFFIKKFVLHCIISVSETEICQQQNKTIQEQLHIKSPGFPNAWTSQIKCQCDIEGQDIVIAIRTLVLMGDLSTSVLNITYHDNGTENSWPEDSSKTIFDAYNRKLVIAVNVTKVTVSVDTSKTENIKNALNRFMFDFKGMIFIFPFHSIFS